MSDNDGTSARLRRAKRRQFSAASPGDMPTTRAREIESVGRQASREYDERGMKRKKETK